jgi:hypothetical protein
MRWFCAILADASNSPAKIISSQPTTSLEHKLDLFGRILFSLTSGFFRRFIYLSFAVQSPNLYFEVHHGKTPQNTSKCLNFSSNRTFSVLLGANLF